MVEFIVYAGVAILVFAVETCCCLVAYRIHRGSKGLDISFPELLLRSCYVAVFFSLIGWSGLLLSRQFGVGHDGYLMSGVILIPIAAQVVNWIFGLDDWPAALGICFLRAIPLLAVGLPLIACGLVSRS